MLRSGRRGDTTVAETQESAERLESPPTAYAGVVTRAIAIAIDALVINAAALAVTGAVLLVESLFGLSHKHHKLTAVIGGVFVAWLVSYFTVFWTTTGQTPGKRVMHVRVIRADGRRLRPRHALIRLGAMVLSLPLFWGYLPMLTSRRRRSVPDNLAGTVVLVTDGPDQHSVGPRRPRGLTKLGSIP